jgi:hypothetical protein
MWVDKKGWGQTLGAWSLNNNCQTWVDDIMKKCKKKKNCKPFPSPPGDDGKHYF